MKDVFELQLSDLLFFVKESCHESLHTMIKELSLLSAEVAVLERQNEEFPEALPPLIKKFMMEIKLHLTLEEKNLFPFIETGVDRTPYLPHLEDDHEKMKVTLLKIRQITKNFEVTENTHYKCLEYYDKLRELERIILNHIQIEDNILFPMVRRVS
ncbi:MAG: hemerythrin domain-containing protein [Bacteriovoracia bacterium]